MLAIRDGKWKLLLNPDNSRVELYDILKDPSETDNKADQQPKIVKKLTKELMDFHNSLPKGPYDTNAGSNTYPWP